MKIVKTVVLVLVGLIAALALVGMLLPGQVRVARSIVVQSSPVQLVAYLDGYRRFNDWSPWAGLDPATKYSFSGPEHGVGAHMEWHSDKAEVGSGRQEVISIEGAGRVRWKVAFAGRDEAEMTFDLAPEDNGTRVTWNIDMNMGANPVGRWFGLMMDGMIGPDFEHGLDRLKAVAEREAPAPPATTGP